MLQRTLPVELDDLLSRDLQLPVCPQVFIRLSQLLENSERPASELTQTLTSDPALAAQVLRVSNSAMYGMNRSLRSIDEAVFRIGYTEVWSIAAALKAKELFSSGATWSAFNERLWKHSLEVGVIARELCASSLPHGADELMSAGILHDIGKLILYKVTPQYAMLTENGLLRGVDLTWREMDFFGTHHARLGGAVLERWNLPHTLTDLVRDHHIQPEPTDPQRVTRSMLMLANVIAHEAQRAGSRDDALPAALLALSGMKSDVCWRSLVQSRQALHRLNSI